MPTQSPIPNLRGLMQKLKSFAKENKLFISVLVLGLLAFITCQFQIRGILVSLNYIYVSLGLLALNLRACGNIWSNRNRDHWIYTILAFMMWFGFFLLIFIFNILTFALFFQNYIR